MTAEAKIGAEKGDRGAILLAEGYAPGRNPGEFRCRFGEGDLLARLVGEVLPLVSETVVIPYDEPFNGQYKVKHLKEVTVATPLSDRKELLLGAGLRFFREPPAKIAVITANFPYLDSSWIEKLFASMTGEVDSVCSAVGERRLPHLAVYRKAVVEALAFTDGDWEVKHSHPGQDDRMTCLQAPLAGSGPDSVASPLETQADYRRALARFGFCDRGLPPIVLELYGNLRIKTGCANLPIHADKIRTAIEVLHRVCPESKQLMPDFERLVDHFRFSVNGRDVTTDLDLPLEEGDQLVLFSAAVGG